VTDDPDFRVELGGHPALVHPNVDVPLTVTLHGVVYELLLDGLVDDVRPVAHVNERIQDAVENAGYSLESYDSMSFSIPRSVDDRVDVELELRVTGNEVSG
jgi:hypothetical protein